MSKTTSLRIDHSDLLRRLYSLVVVPDAVASELSAAVRLRQCATGSCTAIVGQCGPRFPLEAVQTITDDLDLGERSAIALATTLGADLLLIDEAAGSAEARRRNLRVTGPLGVLRAGAEQGLVNVPALIGRLRTTSFYVDDALVNAIFQRWLGP